MLTIALDATYSVGRQLTGVGVYSRRLLDGLAAQHPEVRWQHCFRSQRLLRGWRTPVAANVRRRPLWGPLIPSSADLFHGLNQRLPDKRFRRAVTTFHDLFVLTGDYSTPEFRKRFTDQARDAAERSDLIICVSRFTAGQVEELLGIPSDRLRVIPHGVDLPPSEDIPPVGDRERLILFVGALQRRKNVERLIAAFESCPPEWRLVLAGGHGYEAERIIARVQESPRRDQISVPGFVSEQQLQDLYRRARIFAFPSLDEGFGIPVLEAMAWGIPVLTSNRSALPEAAGTAALLVNPESTEEIRGGLRVLAGDISLARKYAQHGRERAAAFSWSAAVDQTWQVYRELTN